MKSEHLVLAQIGCGYWGPNLLRNFSSFPDCEVRYVADPSPERRTFVQDSFPKVIAVESADVAFDDPEVVAMIVATPAASHFALAKRALEAGKHVLVEKPLGMSASECLPLREAVRADKKAFVAATLKLTDAEAKRFWPIYDAYQRDLDAVNRRRVLALTTLVGRDRPMSDIYARNLAGELLASDEAEIKLRRTLQNRLMSRTPGRVVMPPTKAARYLQLESKIRAYEDYDVAVNCPLIK